ALLVLPFDLHGTGLTADDHQVLGGHHLPAGRAHEHVTDVRDPRAILLAKADHDRILVAALAIEGRLRTGHVALQRVRHARDAQAEGRGLRPIDVDGDSGPALLTGDADVGHAGRALHDGPRVLREPPRIDEVVAANLERQAPIAAPAEHPVHLEVAARRARTN